MALYIDSAYLNDIIPVAGVHDLTIAPQVLLEMPKDSLSEEAIEKFGQDWQKMKNLS